MAGDATDGSGRIEGALELLRRLLPREWGLRGTAEDMRDFYEHRRGEDLRNVRAVLLLVSVLCFLWWPTDPWFFHHDAEVVRAFVVLRTASTTIALSLYFASPRVAFLARRPWLVAIAAGVVVCGVGGYEFGRLGGPGGFWFAFLHAAFLAPMVFAMPTLTRIGVSAGMALAAVIGFYGLHPQHLAAPLAVPELSFFFFVVLVGVLAGMFADRLRHDAFIALRTTERYASQIKGLNAHLEDRVREQTGALRALAAHVQRARERERTHVARELRQALGGEITRLRDAAARGDRARIESSLDRIAATTGGLASDLRPRMLDERGLGAAAAELVERTGARAGLACRLSLPAAELRLPDDIAIVAFRILEESLANVVRHARARTVEVSLAHDGGVLSLVVVDDGCGFEVERPNGAGMGLAAMREHALAAGGALAVESKPGAGTRLVARLPTEAASAMSA